MIQSAMTLANFDGQPARVTGGGNGFALAPNLLVGFVAGPLIAGTVYLWVWSRRGPARAVLIVFVPILIWAAVLAWRVWSKDCLNIDAVC